MQCTTILFKQFRMPVLLCFTLRIKSTTAERMSTIRNVSLKFIIYALAALKKKDGLTAVYFIGTVATVMLVVAAEPLRDAGVWG